MTQVATRLITLIMLLQRQPNQKAADLARKLDVSVRTLHRYFGMLDEMGIPVYTERGPHGGFSLVRGYKMAPLVFTPDEAVAVYLGTSLVEEAWGALYHEAAQGALAKLDNLLPEDQRQEISWARRSFLTAGLNRSDIKLLTPHMEKLRLAVREMRRVNLIYRSSARPEPQSRNVDVYALLHRWGWWYIIGFCHLRQAVRSFRVDRIETLTLLTEKFLIPPGFDIHTYLESEMQFTPAIIVSMRFDAQGADLARANRSSWETLEEQPDGSVIISFASPDENWAISSILAYGPMVTVLEPLEIRDKVSAWAKAIVQLYDEPPKESDSV